MLRQNDQGIREDPDHNRRYAVQKVGCVSQYERSCRSRELREIYAPEKPDRDSNNHGKKKQLGAANDRVCHAAPGLADRCWQLRKEFPVKTADAMDKKLAQDEAQRSCRDQSTDTGEAEHHNVHNFPASLEQCLHADPLLIVLSTSRRA